MMERLVGDNLIDRYFTFNGRTSKDFNLLIQNNFEVEPGGTDVSYTSIPGRNLDIVNPNNRYKNGTLKYECFVDIRWFNQSFYKDLSELKRDLVYWLEVSENYSGYSKLIDNLDENYYYLARLSKTPMLSYQSPERATLTIEFDIGPTKFRVDSQNYQTIVSGDMILNPEPLSSYPIIKVEGTGSFDLTLNGVTYKITELGGLTYIDSTKHRVYDDSKLKNNVAVFPNYSYPVLNYGKNTISWDNESAEVSILMNWRALI